MRILAITAVVIMLAAVFAIRGSDGAAQEGKRGRSFDDPDHVGLFFARAE